MKVLVFCPANLSYSSGTGIRARLIAEGLRQWEADVCVVSYSVPERFASLSITSKLLQEGRSWKDTLLEAISSFHPDILYGITEAGTDAVAYVARKFRLPFAFDIHGLGFIEVIDLGGVYKQRLRRILNSLWWLSRVPSADIVTVLSPTMIPIMKRLNKNTVPVIGMTDVSHFRPDGNAVSLGRNRGRIQVLYTGNFFVWQGVDLLLKAVEILAAQDAPFEFTLLGSIGRQPAWLENVMASVPEDRVHFLETVDYLSVADFYRGADILVLPRPDIRSTRLAFPQKLSDYLASGRAILATDIKPHRWALAEPQAGILCPPTPQGIAEGLIKLADRDLRDRVGSAARFFAEEKLCHVKQSGVIVEAMRSVLGRK